MNNENNNIGNQMPNINGNMNNGQPNNQNLNNSVQQNAIPTMQPQGVVPDLSIPSIEETAAPVNVGPAPVAPTPVEPLNVGPAPVAPTPVEPVNVGPAPVAPTPVAPIQPSNPNQTNIVSTSKAKKNNLKTVIFSLIAFVVVGVATYYGLNYINNSNKNSNSRSEYEETNTNTNTNSTSLVQNYNGFDFTKVSGYTYEVEDGMLDVYNDNYYIGLSVVEYGYDLIKTNYETLKTSLEDRGYEVANGKIQTVSGSELITYEISKDGISGLYFLTSTSNSSYTFEGVVLNESKSVDYNDLNTVVKVTNNSTYAGNYTNYSKDFNLNINLTTDNSKSED